MGRAADGSWDPMAPAGRNPLALTPSEHAALLLAPRMRGPGTAVQVQAYPVRESLGLADHMFARFDDGTAQYIYRGGGRPGPALHAQVDPAQASPDDGRGKRVLYETFLPGQTARAAIQPAIEHARRTNGANITYGAVENNSNALMGDYTARQFNHRVGDGRTWGYRHFVPADVDPVPSGLYRATNPIW